MGFVDSRQKENRVWFSIFVAGLIAGLILRFYLATFAHMPGHGDSAFYYTVAKNIVDGRGPVVDYIVYFFSGLLPLPHYAGDFWNPTASYLIAIPMALLGKSISVALIAPILFGIIPAIAGYMAGSYFAHSARVGALTGILTFFSPFQVWFSATTEAIIFAGAFGALAIYLMMRGFHDPRFFFLAALFTGLTNLIRQDDVLLLMALEICILLISRSWKYKLSIAIGVAAIHMMVLAPLLFKNYSEFHVLFPPGPAKTAFLTSYEDFHSYGKEIDWETLRATWGILGIITRRFHTAGENLGQVNYFLDPVFASLILIAIADLLIMQREKNKLLLIFPAAIFALMEYLFYTLIASFSGPGSLIKSLGVLMPFICLLIVDFSFRFFRAKILLTGSVIVLSIYGGYQGFYKNYNSTLYYNGIYQDYEAVKNIIQNDAIGQHIPPSAITVMARNTWDVYEGTGFKTVMVPNNDIETIVFVAKHYDATYILLPALRPQLDKIYNNTTPDPRFIYIASVPNTDMKIFRINFDQ